MKKIAVWMIVTLLLLSACSGPEPEAETNSADESAPVAEAQPAESELAEEDVAEEDVATEELAEEATEAPPEEAVAEVEPTDQPVEEAVAESGEDESATAEIGPPPEFTADLKATNPDNVVLGNGKPQVVEFFAFW